MTETQIMHLAIWTYFKYGSMTYLLDDRMEAAFWAGFRIAQLIFRGGYVNDNPN